MRIIAGRAGGRSLASPPGREIRPTSDRAKEALFSTIGNIAGTIVADCFAGTGALGCEALSRGADHCYFLDEDPVAIDLIRENLERIEAEDEGIVMEGDVIANLPLIDEDPDLWFLDPPYHTDLGRKTLEAMASAPSVTDRALIVLEQNEREEAPELPRHFRIEDQREYGRTRLTYYRRIVEDEGEET